MSFFLRIFQRFCGFGRSSVEPKVRLQGYGYNPFCSHSSRCLAVLVWQSFEETFCAPKVRLKWYGFKGFPSHSSHCAGGFFPQYSGVSPNFQATNLRLKISIEIENFKREWDEGLYLWGISRSGLKFSIEIENFNRDWTFQARIEIFKRMDWKFHAINRDWIFSIAGPSGNQTHRVFAELTALPKKLSEFTLLKLGVAQTVFWVNRVFCPLPKGAVLTKTAKVTNLHSTYWKQGLRSSDLRKRQQLWKWRVSWQKAGLFFPEKDADRHLETSRPLIFLQKEAVLSPCNFFATTHLTAFILHFYLPVTSRPMKWGTPSRLNQDGFDQDKGQKSAIPRRRLHWMFSFFLLWMFVPFCPRSMCNLIRKSPQNVDKIARFPEKKNAESCHGSGCYGLSRSQFKLTH